MNYAQRAAAPVPQSAPIRGREADMAPNDAGGYGFKLDPFERLERFLILGTEGGTYYASEERHTERAFGCVEECFRANGTRAVALARNVLEEWRAPKADPAIFVLAWGSAKGDEVTKRAAYSAVATACGTATHLFKWVDAHKTLGGGFGPGFRRALRGWYLSRSADVLALQVTKYQSREGWSHLDMLRLFHPSEAEAGAARYDVTTWVQSGELRQIGVAPVDDAPRVNARATIGIFQALQVAETPAAAEAIIRKNRVPREWVKTEHQADPAVWDALLPTMPPIALFRSLGALGSKQLLKEMSANEALVIDRLLACAPKVHPVQVLLALGTYAAGHGAKGQLTWPVNAKVVQALEKAWELALNVAPPLGKRVLISADISKSMTNPVSGFEGIHCRTAACALGLWLANREPRSLFTWFDTDCYRAPLSTLAEMINHRFNPVGTDCAQPMLFATREKLDVDVFVVITDCETWAGKMHPSDALQSYRAATGIDAKLVTLALTATDTSIGDPTSPHHLNVVGLDAAFPSMVGEFCGAKVAAVEEEAA